MKFRLIENILTEGKNIDKTWEQFKDKYFQMSVCGLSSHDSLPDNIIEKEKNFWKKHILSIDPTYVEGSNTTGDFGVWITKMFVSGKYTEYCDSHHVGTPEITELLRQFIKKKPVLEKKDINQYKSIDELQDAITSTDFSDRQKERILRKAYDGATMLFSDDKYQVWIPETYAASCTLGKGTVWCTADSRTTQYYDTYTEDGDKLYIIIDKNDTTKKYQFSPQTGELRNREDNGVSWDYIDDPKVKDAIIEDSGYTVDPVDEIAMNVFHLSLEQLGNYKDYDCFSVYHYIDTPIITMKDVVKDIERESTTDKMRDWIHSIIQEMTSDGVLNNEYSEELWKEYDYNWKFDSYLDQVPKVAQTDEDRTTLFLLFRYAW